MFSNSQTVSPNFPPKCFTFLIESVLKNTPRYILDKTTTIFWLSYCRIVKLEPLAIKENILLKKEIVLLVKDINGVLG